MRSQTRNPAVGAMNHLSQADAHAMADGTPRTARRSSRWPVRLTVLAVCAAVAILGCWADASLTVNAPLERADAIVVLLGGLPYRAMAAGEIFRGGFAPHVVLSRPAAKDPRIHLFRQFGIERAEDDETAARILAGYGVPPAAIRVSVTDHLGTGPELRAVARLLRREGWRSVILVTDPLHIRRASLYMSSQGATGLRVIPRASQSPHGPGRWWRNTQKAEAVLHEYLGLAAFAYFWLAGDLATETEG